MNERAYDRVPRLVDTPPLSPRLIAAQFREVAHKEEFRHNFTAEFSTELLKRMADAIEQAAPKDLNSYSNLCHEISANSGWWDDLEEVLQTHGLSIKNGQRVAAWYRATKLALIHSEASEALEGLRKGIDDDHLPHRSMFEVELADLLIRVFDLAGESGLDLEAAVQEKLAYNQQRADHKKENREAAGGKSF